MDLASSYGLDVLRVNIDKSPIIKGQLTAFVTPTVVIYYKGRELARESKFIDFESLNRLLDTVYSEEN